MTSKPTIAEERYDRYASRMGYRFLCFVFLVLIPVSAPKAGGFTMSFSGTDCSAFPDQATCQSALSQISTSFNSTFSQNVLSDFIGAAGNANAASSRSSFTPGLLDGDVRNWVGISVTGGMQSPKNNSGSSGEAGTNKLPGFGLGAQTFATVAISGEKFGNPFGLALDPKRTSYALSFGTLSLKAKSLQYQFAHFGLGASYILKPPSPWGFGFGWSGLRLSTGLVYTRTSIKYAMPINYSATSGGVTAVWLSALDLGLVSNVFTVPTEVVTGIHLLKIVSLYAGLGVDLNVGGAGSEGTYDGTFSANGSRLTNVHVDMDSENERVTPLQLRTLLGLQIGVDTFSIHAQVAFANPGTIGAQLGLVAAW